PIPGTHFKIKADWEYTRHTDAGDFSHSVSEVKENSHVLFDKLLLTDKKLYHPGETIRLFGLILPETCAPKPSNTGSGRPLTQAEIQRLTSWPGKTPDTLREGTTVPFPAIIVEGCRCDRFHVTAILTPTTVDRAFPVVLRQPITKVRAQVLTDL